jgi:nucleotide-binding universal stress UspA family protein
VLRATKLAAEGGARVAGTLVIQDPDPPVAVLAEAERHELLVVGTHSHSRAGGIILQSITATALHRSRVPVLVARRLAKGSEVPAHILVATDGSACSDVAVGVGARIARQHGSRMTLIQVQDRPDAAGREELGRDAAKLREATGAEPGLIAIPGHPAEGIVEAAGRLGATLIVLGARGLSGVSALGSVSERVAHHAACSVLVVRERRPADRPLRSRGRPGAPPA